MLRLVFFWCCLPLCLPCLSQAPLCEAYNFNKVSLEKKALSGSGLFNVCQDTLGQVWAHNEKYLLRISTQGAVAFAGAGQRGIGEGIKQVFTAYDGHLWVVSQKKLYELDPLRQVFIQHHIIYPKDTLKTVDFMACAYRNGLAVRCKQGSVYYYNPQLKTTSQLLVLKPMPLLFAKCNKGRYKNILLTSEDGVYNVDSAGHIAKTAVSDTLSNIDDVIELGGGMYLTNHLGGKICRINARSGVAEIIGSGLADVQRTMYPVTLHGRPFIGMVDPNGIYLYNDANRALTHWNSGQNQAGEKLQGWTMGMLQDITGRLWILNNETVLNLAPTLPYSGMSAWWPHKDEFATGFNQGLAYSNLVAADRHQPYLLNTYYNELRVYDTATGRLVQKVAVPGDANNRNFYCLLQADSSHWLVGNKTGYLVYDVKANKLLATNINDGMNAFFNILDGADSFYCHTRLGVASIAKNNLRHANFSVVSQRKVAMETDGRGGVWMLTLAGLYKKTARAGWQPLDTLLGKKITLGGASFLYNPYSGRLVVVSGTNLFELDKNTGAILRQVSLAGPGLPSEYTFLEPLSADEIWLGATGSPVIVHNIATHQTHSIGASLGWWPENLGFSSNVAGDGNRNYWVSFDAGFMRVSPSFFKPSANTANPPAISEILLQYRTWPIHPAAYTGTPLEISYKTGHIAFRMEGNELDSIEYRLEPYDAGWHRGHIATYTNLDGGDYIFKSRVAGSSGYSAETVAQLKVIPPVWKQWWFRIMAAMAATAFIWWLAQRRIQRQRKDFQTKIQLAESELKAIRSQMNPHFIFNCMTAIDGLIAGNQKQMASQYLSKFSKLLRRVLQQSEKQLIPLGDDLETLALYLQLEQLRMQHQLQWTIEAGDELRETVMVPPLLLQPFVENAIIHGLKPASAGENILKIGCVTKGDRVVLTVQDNGVGRTQKNNEAHQSMGTQLTSDRLRLLENVTGIMASVHYNDLKNTDGTPAGTEVVITMQGKQP